MAKKVDLEAVQKMQAALVEKAMKLNDEKDGERIAKQIDPLQKEAKQLEAMALVLAHETQAKHGEPPPGSARVTKVRLTEAQVKSVQNKTGERVEVVEIPDAMGVRYGVMPEEIPPAIEKIAIEQVLNEKIRRATEERNKQQTAIALAELRKQNNADLNKQLDEKLKDPDFLDGMFYKGK